MKKKLLMLLLSATATAATFAQQSGSDSPLIPVGGVSIPACDYITRVAYCQDKYFSAVDNKDIQHVYDSSFKEIYTVESELIDNVFYNVPYYHTIINLNECQSQFLDNDSGTFTQKLFNDDSELEYFAFDCEVTLEGGPVEGGMVLTFDGFKIMQTNGNCIAEVTLPNEYVTVYGLGNNIIKEAPMDFGVFVIDKDIYIHVLWGTNNGSYLFKYDKGNAGMTLVSASNEPSMSVYPNPVKAGQPLNIRCKQGIGNAVVNITGLNGTLVKSLNATASAGGALSIPTDGLVGGVYLYTVLSRNRVVVSGKLVVE